MLAETRLLHPAEAFVLRITAVTAAVDAAIILLRGSSVDLLSYAAIAIFAGMIVVAGVLYRRSGRSEALGATMASAGLFILFTSTLSLFNYCLLPNPNPTIDPWLLDLDAALGYHWPDAIAWASQHPAFNLFMKVAYITTLPQIAVLVIVLGFTRRFDDLYGLMLTVTISGTFTILFWGLFPTAGPSAYHSLPDGLQSLVGPVLGPSYGADVTRLLREGPPLLSPDDLRGLVSFPSFHTVLAFTATFYVRRVWWLLPIYLALNLAVLPATLVHGAHHIVDIPAGVAVFLFSAYAAHRMLHGDASAPVAESVR